MSQGIPHSNITDGNAIPGIEVQRIDGIPVLGTGARNAIRSPLSDADTTNGNTIYRVSASRHPASDEVPHPDTNATSRIRARYYRRKCDTLYRSPILPIETRHPVLEPRCRTGSPIPILPSEMRYARYRIPGTQYQTGFPIPIPTRYPISELDTTDGNAILCIEALHHRQKCDTRYRGSKLPTEMRYARYRSPGIWYRTGFPVPMLTL